MQISVKVIAGASRNCVKTDDARYKIYVTAPADKGKANQAAIGLLADYFSVSKAAVHIVRGLTSSLKTVEIQK